MFYLEQLSLLLWKNFTIQKRSLLGTLLILILPALFAVILMPIRTLVKSNSYPNVTTFKTIRFSTFDPELPLFGNSTFAYAPNNSDFVNKLMNKVATGLNLNYESFRTENELIDYMSRDFKYKLFAVKIVNESAKNFTYKLRFSYSPRNEDRLTDWKEWRTNLIWPVFPVLGPRAKQANTGGEPGYYIEGFLTVQKAIDYALIGEFTTKIKQIEIQLKRFLYGPYEEDNFVIVLIASFPYIIELSFAFTVILTARKIALEKETGLKEAMKLMGTQPWLYWLSWYIKTFVMLLPALAFMIFAYTIKLPNSSGNYLGIINKSDPILFGVLLFLYASSMITFTLLCSTFFKRSNTATAGTGIIYFMSYLPYILISLRYEQLSLFWKILACFVNNLAMCLGMQLIGIFEGQGFGMQFSNFTQGISYEDEFSFAHVLFFLCLDNLIHVFLIYYFDNLFPGDHGIAKPWHFIFTEFYKNKYNNKVECQTGQNLTNAEEILVEDEAIYNSQPIGISLQNLSKIYKQFGQEKLAVKNLNLNAYEGQITVLLGHNGAGKSTTISMITGLCEPTSGSIQIKNKDILKETKEARSLLGYCPQHNLLFDELTVLEHLTFFAKLKRNYDENEINYMLDLINLSDKRNQLAKTLSGGMKRKLSIAIAFIGGSKIVILDEPSSGMDPQARHSTWSLLKKFKTEHKCTILMTTHFMDEADYLGDRIAIMSKGKLKCCGTPLYLKSNYGSGYTLVLTRENSNELISTNKLDSLVKSVIPNSRLNSNINSEISFLLSAEDSHKFPNLFETINKHKDEFNIINVGISATTVEQVFLKIEDDNIKYVSDSNKNETQNANDLGLWVGSKPEHLIENRVWFFLNQLIALTRKRLIFSTRTKSLVLSQIIFPIVILVINLLFIKYGPVKYGDSEELPISMNKYAFNYLPYSINSGDSNPTSLNNQFLSKVADYFQNQFNDTDSVRAFILNDTNSIGVCANSRSSIKDYMSCLGKISHKKLNAEHVTAVEFIYNNKTRTFDDRNLKMIGWFNNQAYHVPPLSLNLITNALLKYFANSSNYSINVINHPLPQNLTDTVNEILTKDIVGFTLASCLTLGLSFLMASFSIFLINERSTGSKHLQFLNGCNAFVYWFNAFVYDFVNYLIPTALITLILVVANVEGLVSESKWIYLIVLFLAYGLAHIPQMYLLSNKFNISSTGYSVILTWNILTSQFALVIIRILSIPTMHVADFADFLQTILLLVFPNYSLGQGIIDMYENSKVNKICVKAQKMCRSFPNPCCRYAQVKETKPCGNDFDCLYWNEDYWTWQKPGLSRFVFIMLVQCVLQLVCLIIYEAGVWRRFRYFIKRVDVSKSFEKQLAIEKFYGDIDKDSDVVDEENRIRKLSNLENNQEMFYTNNLTKYYEDFKAVKGISFSIKNSECFGLLGINGAGKTTTFKMITGDETITEGEVYLNQFSIKENLHQFQRNLGYCPQLDPLIDQMTVKETLELYFKLRGIKSSLIEAACDSLIDLLDLSEYKDKMCFSLSGGNKRKLSVAISLVGSPAVVLLDEPTSGMDPKTRRTLWNSLNNIRNKGKSLILTTHNMDETEALCTKIGIMINGELKCIGSLQHLKNRYGEGYTLLVKIKSSTAHESPQKTNLNEFIRFVFESFENTELKENRHGYLNFHISNKSASQLSKIFSTIEENKLKYSIEYYAVTETILEQIFLNFASRQIDPGNEIFKNIEFNFNRLSPKSQQVAIKKRTPTKEITKIERTDLDIQLEGVKKKL